MTIYNSISPGNFRKNPPQSPFFNPPKTLADKRGKPQECPALLRKVSIPANLTERWTSGGSEYTQ